MFKILEHLPYMYLMFQTEADHRYELVITNASGLYRYRLIQTGQTQIRLLLIRFFPVCYSDKHIVNGRGKCSKF